MHNVIAIETFVENFFGAVLKALTASTPKCRPCDDPRLPIPDCIQDNIRLKNRLSRQWQITREPALKAEFKPPSKVADSQGQRVEERPVEHDVRIPRF